MEKIELELASLAGSAQRYADVLEQKKQAIKNAGNSVAQLIQDKEAQIAQLQLEATQLQEAIAAANAALCIADRLSESLHTAENLGMWDMVGGGLLTSVAKHSELDEAQEIISQLQQALQLLQKELTEVDLTVSMPVQDWEFLRFADYVFDGMLVDGVVLSKIHDLQDAADAAKEKIQTLLNILAQKDAECRQKQEAVQAALRGYVEEYAGPAC